jgi:hypothetical protein
MPKTDTQVINPNRSRSLTLPRVLALMGLTTADIQTQAAQFVPTWSRGAPGHLISAYCRRSPAKRAKHLARGGR